MADRQGFGRATRLIVLLLALLPAWYLLHEHFTLERGSQPHDVTLTETVVRITVGLIGFLAVVLLILGGKRPRAARERKREQPSDLRWFACPACGQRVQRRAEESGAKATCPTCNGEFVLSSVLASTADVGAEEDVSKWLQELSEQRQRIRRR